MHYSHCERYILYPLLDKSSTLFVATLHDLRTAVVNFPNCRPVIRLVYKVSGHLARERYADIYPILENESQDTGGHFHHQQQRQEYRVLQHETRLILIKIARESVCRVCCSFAYCSLESTARTVFPLPPSLLPSRPSSNLENSPSQTAAAAAAEGIGERGREEALFGFKYS